MRRLDRSLERDPVIETCERDVDRTLLRENPRRSVEERIEALVRASRLPGRSDRRASERRAGFSP